MGVRRRAAAARGRVPVHAAEVSLPRQVPCAARVRDGTLARRRYAPAGVEPRRTSRTLLRGLLLGAHVPHVRRGHRQRRMDARARRRDGFGEEHAVGPQAERSTGHPAARMGRADRGRPFVVMAGVTPRPRRILPVIIVSQFAGTSLWFAGNAVLADLQREWGVAGDALGYMTSAVQLGFVAGTLVFAFFAISDRYSPRKVFLLSSLLGACFNGCLYFAAHELSSLLALRFATGFFLAGIYP